MLKHSSCSRFKVEGSRKPERLLVEHGRSLEPGALNLEPGCGVFPQPAESVDSGQWTVVGASLDEQSGLGHQEPSVQALEARETSRAVLRSQRRPVSGFTIIELVIVVIVLGILVAVGGQAYHTTIQRSYFRSAQSILRVIYSGERAHFFKANDYRGPLTDASPDAEWRQIFMDDPNFDPARVEYSVCVSTETVPNPGCCAGADCFVATAVRKTGPCSNPNRTLTINQLRAFGGDWEACLNAL